jgi:hypothetical protein
MDNISKISYPWFSDITITAELYTLYLTDCVNAICLAINFTIFWYLIKMRKRDNHNPDLM